MLRANDNKLVLNQNLEINYPVYFSEGIFNTKSKNSNNLSKICRNKKIMVVIDKNVNKIYGKEIKLFFGYNRIESLFWELNASEDYKNIEKIKSICISAKQFGMQRDSIFIAIGGGVTMDIVGFAASIYRRKIPFIRIPTTLVGIVDAGVGVKVGVNFDVSKNFLGSYYPPLAVFNDQLLLKTLTSKEIKCGLFEILKMAIIKDERLFRLIKKYRKVFFEKEFNSHTHQINYLATFLMMEELEKNLFETNLQRLVDFGHTFSPFLETDSSYLIPHGEAVGIDMLISSYISLSRKLISKVEFENIFKLIKQIGFSKRYRLPEAKALYASLNEIIKHRAGNLNLVLPCKIGSAAFTNKCSYNDVENATKFLLSANLFSQVN